MDGKKKITRRSVLAKGVALGAAAGLTGSMLNAAPAQAWALGSPVQRDWRFCNKCFSLVRLDSRFNNACAAGGGHTVQGWNFQMQYNTNMPSHTGETSQQQSCWAQCGICSILYYDEVRWDPGHPCAGWGNGHTFDGNYIQYLMPHDIYPQPANTQAAWRACFRCGSMYFDGYAPNRGVCKAGWGHAAAGYLFQIPVFSY